MGIKYVYRNNNNEDGVTLFDKYTSISNCDFTVEQFSDLEDIADNDGRIAINRRCHINNTGRTFKWNGTIWVDITVEEPVPKSLATCDETVGTIAERDALVEKIIGKQVHVLNNGDVHAQTYIWSGTEYLPFTFDFIDFDTSETQIPQLGRIGWDSDAKTITIGLANDVNLQVGQEQYIRAKNVSGEKIYNGEAVYVVGASGNRIEVTKAIASEGDAIRTIAICTEESIGNNSNGFFTTMGIINDINTSIIGINPQEGDALYLSSSVAGAITNVKPDAPNYCVCIGYIVRVSTTVGQILVKIGSNPKVDDLSDVDLTGLIDGDQIYYHQASGVWKRIDSGFNAISRWDDWNLNPEALGTGASAPDLIFINGSNLRMYGFNGGTTTEQLYGSFEILHGYKEGTDLRPHIHWCPTTTGTGNVKWQLEYEIHKDTEAFTGATTTIVAIDSANGVAYQNLVVEFGIISGVGLTIGTQCKFRLFRVPNDVQDTYSSDAGLLTVGIHYEVDSDGSRSVMAK